MVQRTQFPHRRPQIEQRRVAIFWGGFGSSALLGFLVVALLLAYSIYAPRAASPHSQQAFSVTAGQGVSEIGAALSEAGIIKHPLIFYLYTLKRGLGSSLQAGLYNIPADASVAEIVSILAKGAVVKDEVSITIPEGFNLLQIEGRAREYGLGMTGESLSQLKLADAVDPDSFLLNEFEPDAGLEGFLFPDTYYFSKGTTLKVIAKRLVANFISKTEAFKPLPNGRTFNEVLVMASILEKEVRGLRDKQLVSGILWRRLGAKIPLQVDASVIYAQKQAGDGPTYINLNYDSPFNTYRHLGLPPAPISNPGLESIMAAANPQDSPYWFYLSAKNGGETIFSKNFNEHIAAKRQHL